MNRSFDRYDFIFALGLFAGVSAWASLWPEAVPHPALWPFLSAKRQWLDLAALAFYGRFALGLLAALVFLVLRGAWFRFQEVEEDPPELVRYARAFAVCGALIVPFVPYLWRGGLFLSPIMVGVLTLFFLALALLIFVRYGHFGFFFAVVATCGLILVARRLTQIYFRGRLVRNCFLGALATTSLALIVRSVDWAERARLEAMHDYVSFVIEDSTGVKTLFTDGRFDDLLRIEFAARGVEIDIRNAMKPENAEIFKIWAREDPDRLAECAWQLGADLVRRYGKAVPRTVGMVHRCVDAARSARDDAADQRLAAWSERLLQLAGRKKWYFVLLGEVDAAVGERFDAILWRAARQAHERGENALAERLDRSNVSLRAWGEIRERLSPTEQLVLTPRESLEIALKRADFQLAVRYAREVLASEPENSAANFALGMAKMENKEYFGASVCFEKALKKNPREPAALNNLAIAYMKIGNGEKALKAINRAAEIYPASPEIQQTRREIQQRTR